MLLVLMFMQTWCFVNTWDEKLFFIFPKLLDVCLMESERAGTAVAEMSLALTSASLATFWESQFPQLSEDTNLHLIPSNSYELMVDESLETVELPHWIRGRSGACFKASQTHTHTHTSANTVTDTPTFTFERCCTVNRAHVKKIKRMKQKWNRITENKDVFLCIQLSLAVTMLLS